MSFRNLFTSAVSSLVMLAMMPHPASAQVEEIVVTARKRDESILETPIAVTAFSGEDLDVRGVVTLQELATATPGLNINSVSSGRSDRSFQSISLRGFTPSAAASTLTTTFIDGVPVSSPTALNNVTDPERIEILRGPQAAYFGRNSFAGAVNVVNRTPNTEGFGGKVSAMVGSESNHDIQGSIEGPLFNENYGFRVTGRQFARDGTYDNRFNPSETLGDQETTTFSLFLTANPTENFSAKFYGFASFDSDGPSSEGQLSAYEIRNLGGAFNISGDGMGTLVLPSVSNCTLNGWARGDGTTGGPNPDTRVMRPYICGAAPSLPSEFSPAANTAVNPNIAASLANQGGKIIPVSDGPDGYGLERHYYHFHITLDYVFGDSGFSLTSLSGYNDEEMAELDDLDNYDNSTLANPTAFIPGTQATWDFPFMVEREGRDWSTELRLNYDQGGAFSAVVGASHLETNGQGGLISVFAETIFGAPRNPFSAGAPRSSETSGVFFGLNYDFTERLRVSAEGRYQKDTIVGFTGNAPLTLAPGNAVGLPPGNFGRYQQFTEADYNNFLPRLIGQYDLNDDLMVYASWSEGIHVGDNYFNPGLISGTPTAIAAVQSLGLQFIVQPEELTNFELGIKGTLFDGQVAGSLIYYNSQWKNQTNQRSILFVDSTGIINLLGGLANSGSADLQGLELDLRSNIGDNVTVNFAASLNDSEINSFSDPQVSRITGSIGDDFRGNQNPASSKFSANLGVQYDGALAAWGDATWFARADVSYKSKQFADAANITWIDPRTQVNLRAGIARGPWTVDAFVINAFDNEDYLSIGQNGLLTPSFALAGAFGYLNVGLPTLRTFGLKAAYQF